MYSHGSKEKRRGGRGWYEGPGGLGSQLIHADGYKNTPPPLPPTCIQLQLVKPARVDGLFCFFKPFELISMNEKSKKNAATIETNVTTLYILSHFLEFPHKHGQVIKHDEY